MKLWQTLSATTLALGLSVASASAADLTLWGAEQGANADGSIPAYPAQPYPAPATLKPGTGHWPDLFPDEKPLYSVTRSNLNQYENLISEGMKGLFERFDTFRMDVYPTHRTAYYSDWEQGEIRKNATRSKLTASGEGVENTYGPVPFPEPKSGLELLWNHFNRAEPVAGELRGTSHLINSDGRITDLTDLHIKANKPIMDPERDSLDSHYKHFVRINYLGPVSQAGRQALWYYSQDYEKADQIFYLYTPGQRRVRIAPDFGYDTPASTYSGAMFYDEVSLFEGRPDRFDWNIIGKRELLVPYNNNRMNLAEVTRADLLHQNHLNPDLVRWEKHRVWVLEATRKEGKQHVYSKRRFYVDEDSWAIMLVETYDSAGNLYRVGMANPSALHANGSVYNYTQSFVMYDLVKNNYVIANWLGESRRNFMRVYDKPFNRRDFTPDALQAAGIR